jgi:kumamolisin
MPIHPYIKFPRTRHSSPWNVLNLCQAYNLPRTIANPNTRPIGVVSFGGAYNVSDMSAFCTKLSIPVPTVVPVGTPGQPDPGGADVENMLDTEVITAVYYYMTGTVPNIRFYNATDFVPTINQAAADGCSMLSISWGADENEVGAANCKAVNDALYAAIQGPNGGMAACAATGDNDAGDGGPTPANVDSPSSCPLIIACGGTRKPQTGAEVVWGYAGSTLGSPNGEGTGAGYSTVFPLKQANQPGVPAQTAAYIKDGYGQGRLVPDFVSNADPTTGVMIYANGQWITVGGTSASAPFFSGMLGSINCNRNGMKMKLTTNYKTLFNDITSGNNGLYASYPGIDPVSGYGSPNGTAIYNLLSGLKPA